MNWFEIYLWTRLDMISGITLTFAVLFGIIAVISVVGSLIYAHDPSYAEYTRKSVYEKSLASWRMIRKWTVTLACIAIPLAIAVPTKSDLALIYGLHWATNNEDVKAIPDDAVKLIREWLNEARPEKEDK